MDPTRPRPYQGGMWRLLPSLGFCLLSACGTLSPRPLPAVPPSASAAFADARRLEREGRFEEAREEARRARDLMPDWIAPRRFLDDLARAELRTPALLERYRRELAQRPLDPVLLYLAGRLSGKRGDSLLRRARRADPGRGWVWHGLAWNAHLRGDDSLARRYSRRAQSLARDPYERAYFAWARAAIESSSGEEERALRLLAEGLDDPGIDPTDRVWLAVTLARLELKSGSAEVRRRGVYRALSLIEGETLRPEELSTLLESAAPWEVSGPGSGALYLALADSGHREELVHLMRPSRLALALAEGSGGGPSRRRLRFAYGDPSQAVEEWVRDLPPFLREGEVPRDARLAQLQAAARALGGPDVWTPEAARRFGEALVAAGWFEEARAFAGRLPAGDLEGALALDRQARAGEAILSRLASLGNAIARGRARSAPDLSPAALLAGRSEGQEIEDLDGLLAALAETLARVGALLGWEGDSESWRERLAATPRIHFGPLGTLLHPGPRFSALDEAQGLGARGARVPGLPDVLDRLGAFGLFGRGLGRPVDGALLGRVWVEERRGVHLGVPWRGTVFWCDGARLAPMAGRGSERIAGAALHEGYWIDLAVLRGERARWRKLWERFEDRIPAVLAVPPLHLAQGEEASDPGLLLGAADRLRLAIMRDRGGALTLEELCRLTALHEEGHLCDRARFFPFEENWLEVLGFLASSGFSPRRLAERLEERAQLVALCEAADPRPLLVELLEAAEEGGAGETPHGAAYARLCREFLEELAAQVDLGRIRGLDPSAFLGQQTHRLSPDEVRGVALALARRRGLVR